MCLCSSPAEPERAAQRHRYAFQWSPPSRPDDTPGSCHVAQRGALRLRGGKPSARLNLAELILKRKPESLSAAVWMGIVRQPAEPEPPSGAPDVFSCHRWGPAGSHRRRGTSFLRAKRNNTPEERGAPKAIRPPPRPRPRPRLSSR